MAVLKNVRCPEGRNITVWLENEEKCEETTCHIKSCRHHPSNFKSNKEEKRRGKWIYLT